MILRPLIFCSPHSFPLYLMQDGFLQKMYRRFIENVWKVAIPTLHCAGVRGTGQKKLANTGQSAFPTDASVSGRAGTY